MAGFRPARGRTYVVRIQANTANGGVAAREVTLVGVA
jgi:hypothetical protein